MKLTAEQIRGHASAAGFSGKDLDIAVAVALAESGGNTRAHNAKPPDDSYGLWQINMLGKMGPARRKQYGLKSNEDLYEPATNARVAHGIFKGSGWQAWTTYTRGTYRQHMDSDTESVETVAAPTDGGLVTGGLNSLGANIFTSLANMAGVGVALALFVAAIVLFLVQSRAGKKIVKSTVGKVTS